MLILILTLTDGSALRLDVDKAYVFEIQTKYGVLSVPATDIVSADLGSHCDDAAVMDGYYKQLGDKDFKVRDKATRFFRANFRESYPYIKKALDSTDLEMSRRAKTLLKEGEAPRATDEFTLLGNSIQGLWRAKEITGVNRALGKMTVRVSQIDSIAITNKSGTISLVFEDGWKELGYINNKCHVSADGQVDMWPQNAGSWVATPTGHQNTQFDGYPAGALLGRMRGKVFIMGNEFQADNMGRGKLEVKINGAPWSNHFEGEFHVTLK